VRAKTNGSQSRVSLDDQLRKAVLEVVAGLQRRLFSEPHDAYVLARLAKLRRAVTSAPGSDPDVWADTIGALPERLSQGAQAENEPTHFERAAHEAITLYALHQQSRTTAVHRQDISLGSAARRLARATGRDDAIRSRFQAVATAGSAAAVLHHLRALITLLRSESIQLDYAQLAVDLRQLHEGTRADQVRLRWGRDFHRATKEEAEDSAPDQTSSH
jgi:CRISPR system Cascade subunit CasB